MQLHCDSCGKGLGTYLHGKGGIEEKAHIFGQYSSRLPDIVCNECWSDGFGIDNPKYPEKVYSKDYLESRKTCPNCGQQINRPVEKVEEKLKMATAFETGKGIYYAILDHKFRSIDLCNWCYSVMQTYRHTLSKEDRDYKERKGNSSQH